MLTNWITRLLGSGPTAPDGRTPDAGLWPAGGAAEASSLGAVIDPPELLQTELERARRHRRGLAVVVLEIAVSDAEADSATPASPAAKVQAPQMRSMLAVAALGGMLRQTDVLCYQPAQDRFVLGLTECTTEEARRAVWRIAGTLRARLSLEVRAGVARFPDDALTLADLVDAAVAATPEAAVDPSVSASGAPHGERRRTRPERVPPGMEPHAMEPGELALNGTGPHADGGSDEGHDG